MKILNTISKNKHLSGADPFMAIGTSVLVTAFVLFTILLPEYSDTLFNNAKQFIAKNFAWYYILLISILLFLAVFIAFSRYGSLKLGKDNEKPEFSFFAWFSMLFGAGIGIGILFWSIAEPIYHFQSNPFISPEQNLSIEAAQVAMRISIFHWGLHGWAMFAISGLALAYFSYRRGLPLSVRSTLYPILGDKIYGYIGHSVDMLAIFSTLFGIATSLGLGAQQMNAGFSYLFGLNISITNQVIIIGTISILATLSVLSGVHKGIKFLSELNMSLTIIILLFFLLLGPTVYLLGAFVTNLGDYFENFIVLG
ncbi:MAG: BCCT family transporter, partial [Kangiellaceae bacterium]